VEAAAGLTIAYLAVGILVLPKAGMRWLIRDVGILFDLESDGIPSRKMDRVLMAFGTAILIPK
jgi:hypothetical protein